MTPEQSELVGQAWLEQGLVEHASVAAFGRFSLQLMHLGAPPDLLLGSIRAMEDEVHHARLCLALARRFRGKPASPGKLDVTDAIDPTQPIAELLDTAIIEGCINETVAVRQVEVARERCRDAEICTVLERIITDESRHVELAWRFVEWMLGERPELRASAEVCFLTNLEARSPEREDGPRVLEDYGQLLASSRAAVRVATIRERIGPRAARLLAGRLRERYS